MNNVLVAGGAGFIGSHLCESLLNDGYRVFCLDNFLTGNKKNVSHLLKNKNFILIQTSIEKHFALDEKMDYVFNLASPASPIDYWNYPEETLITNSVGNLRLLRLAVKDGGKFLLASTSEVYGDPQVHPQTEKYFGNVNTFGPRSCYDESKRFAETSVYVYIQKYNLDARIVRIFNTYGPKMKKDDGRVVSNFINWALSGSEIKIDGDGSQTRSFCFVSDMVDGIKKAMFSNKTNSQIYNLGNPNEFTIKQLADLIIEMTKSKSIISYSKDFRTNDPMRRKPDITKAMKDLGWEPKVKLPDGIKKTIEFYKD